MTSDIERARRDRRRADRRSARYQYMSGFRIHISLCAPRDWNGRVWLALTSIIPIGLLVFAIYVANRISRLSGGESSDGVDDGPGRGAA